MERAKFGAIMSRMNVVIDNLTNVSQNQRASRAELLMLILFQELRKTEQISDLTTISNEYGCTSF